MAKETEPGKQTITMTLDELTSLVDARVARASRETRTTPRFPVGPKRGRVFTGRHATSAGIFESYPQSWWDGQRKAIDAEPNRAIREAMIKQFGLHRAGMHELDPIARKTDEFIAARWDAFDKSAGEGK